MFYQILSIKLNVDLSFADLSLILTNEGYFLTIFSAAGSCSEENSNSSNRWVVLTINFLAVTKTFVLGNLFKLSRFSSHIRTCRWSLGKSEKKKWTCIFPIRQCHFNFAQKLESCTCESKQQEIFNIIQEGSSTRVFRIALQNCIVRAGWFIYFQNKNLMGWKLVRVFCRSRSILFC